MPALRSSRSAIPVGAGDGYALVQQLNRMQAEDVSYRDDTAEDAGADRRKRVSAAHWHAIPHFAFQAPTPAMLARAALPGLALLLGWALVVGIALVLVSRRLGAR